MGLGLSDQELHLCNVLKSFPQHCKNRYNDTAASALVEALFKSLTGYRNEYLQLLFPHGIKTAENSKRWSLRASQGAIDGAEYTEAARGHPCGHIFRSGESTYRCKTCSDDDTAVLCAKCFTASDHEGHAVYIQVSPGNSGCCDCGDTEAWKRDTPCMIHSLSAKGKSKQDDPGTAGSALPPELEVSIRMTISRVLDYFCDVWSCAPEQLRLLKDEAAIRQDEERSRLHSLWYKPADEEDDEFALILWNDEKHTVRDVQDVVARACSQTKNFGAQRAVEVDEVGRTVLDYSRDLPKLLRAAKIIEQPKLTVTIRSARDVFRESMCETIMEWILDISGCSVGSDAGILRTVVCSELLNTWRVGSQAHHLEIGEDGLDDHEAEDMAGEFLSVIVGGGGRMLTRNPRARTTPAGVNPEESDETDANADDDIEMGDVDDESAAEMDFPNDDLALEASEATLAGYPPPPPPPHGHPPGGQSASQSVLEPPLANIPKTPSADPRALRDQAPGPYWMERPSGYRKQDGVEPSEDLWQRIRLDYLILYDMRMWKQLRSTIRDVLIGTVVTQPVFKRLLGLRFAGVYTVLAELYLIADREPDHSIINLSLQMLTTPSITAEVVERGNFFTNLMAILYTFLTTRQVGYPNNVNLKATLEFEQGAIGNRRIYQFYHDMHHLLGSEYVQNCIRTEPRYLMQFLDLVKLHQGVCPNVRQTGEHVEFEADAWIQARIVTDEIMKLSRKFTEAYTLRNEEDVPALAQAIGLAMSVTISNVMGEDIRRFQACELKRPTRFHLVDLNEYGTSFRDAGTGWTDKLSFRTVEYEVAQEPMSFHHALHHNLSWLLDKAKALPIEQVKEIIMTGIPPNYRGNAIPPTPEGLQNYSLLALFDFPLRVCAWLAQLRAGMWIRNGMSLRHQMQAHKNVQKNNMAYHRDLFLLQTAMVVCEPESVLAQAIDRFDLRDWVIGDFKLRDDVYDENQKLDVAEDFVHLLIVLLTDRTHLRSPVDEPNQSLRVTQRDLIHALCFKPLSMSELLGKVSERTANKQEIADLLGEIATFRPPEGLSDHGLFIMRDECYQEVDPYLAWFSRQQREEAEIAYKTHVGKLRGIDPAAVVYEPKLLPITSGMFVGLGAIVRTTTFSHTIFNLLRFAAVYDLFMPKLTASKVDQFLGFVIHLVMVAVMIDGTELSATPSNRSFCQSALLSEFKGDLPEMTDPNVPKTRGDSAGINTIAGLLHVLAAREEFKANEPKIHAILRHIRENAPEEYAAWSVKTNLPVDRADNASPASALLKEKELKKKQAMERQAKVLADMKKQQTSFLQNQIDWGDNMDSDDDSDFGMATPDSEAERVWKYPAGNCILCQEECDSTRLYGTFALVNESNVMRQTKFEDDDWVSEVLATPTTLDRPLDSIRPFGVSSQNRRTIHKVSVTGKEQDIVQVDLGKGFPMDCTKTGPVSTGCGHLMHFRCFEVYLAATHRRHANQVTRRQPERTEFKEFLCPLCKALGNAFLPLIWKGKNMVHPGVLQPNVDFDQFLEALVPHCMEEFAQYVESGLMSVSPTLFETFSESNIQELIPSLASLVSHTSQNDGIFPAAAPSRSAVSSLLARLPMFAPGQPMWPSESDADPQQVVPSSSSAPVRTATMAEVVRAYGRLYESLKANTGKRDTSQPSPSSSDLLLTDVMMKLIGHSISAVEIAYRGTRPQGVDLIESLSNQTTTHLRVLSQSVSTYIAISSMRSRGANHAAEEVVETKLKQTGMLFCGHPILGKKWLDLPSIPPALAQDSFLLLAECAECLVVLERFDIHHIITLCFLLEMVRVCHCFVYDRQSGYTGLPGSYAKSTGISDAFFSFFQVVIPNWQLYWNEPDRARNFSLLQKLMNAYALVFLRKTAILMYIKYGIDFSVARLSVNPEASELERLAHMLNLPLPAALFESSVRSPTLVRCVEGWLYHYGTDSHKADRQYARIPVSVSHPAILELIALPELYSTLQEETAKRKCPTLGKELADPNLCLFCGHIFCGQAVCCLSSEGKGGCWQHRQTCGGQIGMFINIRKCMILLLNGNNGSWFLAPYLDRYGEVDPALRRHQELYLNQKRYDALIRNIWLQHQVPSTIARRLEGDNNTGGWETI